MNQDEIIARWKKETPQYDAWGKFVRRHIAEKIGEMKDAPPEDFLESIRMRLKAPQSLCDKIMSKQGKRYEDINDKVGLRFIVFVENDLDVVVNAMWAWKDVWKCEQSSNAQDYRINKHDAFGYAGDHYIIRNKKDLDFNKVNIPKDTTCEVQIRTIFQHAAASFSHHYSYKKGYRSDEFQREIAKMRALAEVVDKWSAMVAEDVKKMNDPWNIAYCELKEYYTQHIIHDHNIAYVRSAMDILHHFNPDQLKNLHQRIDDFCKQHSYIINIIKDRRNNHRLFRHPVILFAYLMVNSLNHRENIFPFMNDSLKLVYTDLGKKFED